MKRLLLVSYYYPPLAGPGVFRPLRLSKHLPERGWSVTVLTVGARARVLRDPGLGREVPPEVRVLRSASIEPRVPLLALRKLGLTRLATWIGELATLPDEQRGWVPFATRKVARLLRDEPHQVVLSTSAPYSAHLVGMHLQRRFGIPWVADFRDEWTTNPYIRYPTGWHRRQNQRLEQRVLRAADRVVSVSEPWLANLASLVSDLPRAKFRCMPNGYDADHFAEPRVAADRFRIVYTGAFYGPRSPDVFIEAIATILARNLIPRDELEVTFVGHTGNAAGLARLPPRNVRVIEQRPYAEALQHLGRAAVLLLVIPRAGGPGNHTGKLFNYLAAGRPILALAPRPNVAAELILETRSGRVVPPDDPRAVSAALVGLYQEWKTGRALPDQDRRRIARYEARSQADDWVRFLETLVQESARRPGS